MLLSYPRDLPLNSAYAMPSGHVTKQELLFDFSVSLADIVYFFPMRYFRLKNLALL